MSKIPRLARSANIAETKYQVTTKIKSCIKLINLDRTKIYKCRRCNNIVDLTCEGWTQKELLQNGKITDYDARHFPYVCNYCKNADKIFNSLKEKLESAYNRVGCRQYLQFILFFSLYLMIRYVNLIQMERFLHQIFGLIKY